jgi:transcriptional regulator with XRE-family HTH domain
MNRSGQKLRAVRERAGLSTMEVAFRADITQQYLMVIESGRKPLTDSALVKIAGALQMSMDDLERAVSGGSRRARKPRSQGAAA